MGAEAYGLVGFFALIQAWFQILDMGLSPTISRETARYRGGVTDALSLRRLFRALEWIFLGVAVVGGAAMIAASNFIAGSWLKAQQLPLAEVRRAIMLIAIIVALRWVCGLYRGAITGFEALVWLGNFNILVATARNVLVLLVFWTVGTTPTAFFGYQLVCALVEVIGLIFKTHGLLPKIPAGVRPPFQWKPLRGVLNFSLSLAFVNTVWLVLTQTDKLMLSRVLSLKEYAFFTIAVLVAGGVTILGGPISTALLPRMSKLTAEGNNEGMITLYRNATQIVAVIAVPASIVLACFAEKVLWVWTGNPEIAHAAAPILTLYAIGNGIMVMAAFPYYFQFAIGDLTPHVVGNILFVVFLIPALIWATSHFGARGAGYVWLISNALYFMVGVPLMHRRFAKGLQTLWLTKDVGIIVLPTLAGAGLSVWLIRWPQGRLPLALVIGSLSFTLLLLAAACSSWVRMETLRRWTNWSQRA
jgi:O-antigen/teichoic acid export membrane protein